ncbi:MAG: CoA activase [Verrucomicrobia bacterium]|nr:CoA activase [Verrucomicrobiota bacterium]
MRAEVSSTVNGAAGLAEPEVAPDRFVGIDLGAETIKVVELVRDGSGLRWVRRQLVEHQKDPGPRLLELLAGWGWDTVCGGAVSGRLSRQVNLPRIPTKQAQARGYRFLFDHEPATLVSIGNHGFSVLELRSEDLEVFRENSRCSQGTGNFLRQLVERFSLTIAEASELCADTEPPAPLSGRCPVILKTDMTHLANQGENRAAILAGLFDAVCENVLGLIKPATSPARVLLIGGVSRSRRIQRTFGRALAKQGMRLVPLVEDDALFFEALGDAVLAAEAPQRVPALAEVLAPPAENRFPRVAALAGCLGLVEQMQPRVPGDRPSPDLNPGLSAIRGTEAVPACGGWRPAAGRQQLAPGSAPLAESGARTAADVILGFDIGSTGSKLVALDAVQRRIAWEGYRRTSGEPVGAGQALLRDFVAGQGAGCVVRALGVCGSGREIVGSLLATCYGTDAVFVLNEIAAHAEGALHYDSRVDTIFEIGGQDAKYIRLAEGRVIDCAMNEACSAGTGSFIEEQGRKFAGVRDVTQLGREALAAPSGISLGQHCSVFMAEVIDAAVAAGVERASIVAGLYDSIIQNYLHRVKGNRSVGEVIFCQGMPFSAPALAAAVARQTGSRVIIPPNPGTVGALGIALLAHREIPWRGRPALDPSRFLEARIEQKETFVCRSTSGCGSPGNRCRIDSIKTVVAGQRQRFSWGGACSLHDKGARKRKLPDRSPDPFRQRAELVQELTRRCRDRRGRPTVGLADEFSLKGWFPFFATFLSELDFDLVVPGGADQSALKLGIQEANVPFCAPMQLYHGLVSRLAEAGPDWIFAPMIRSLPRVAGERDAVVCPVVQGSGAVLRWDLKAKVTAQWLCPVIDVGSGNLASAEFVASCQRLAHDLGVREERWRRAYAAAVERQEQFERGCGEIGRQALAYCVEHGLPAVVVLGRPYTIHNKVLNSNVPAILREQGVLALPLECCPVSADTVIFDDMYWGDGQRILRAAHQVRRTPGVYAIYCSNYSCGPDSFNLHFCSYIMEGKPFAIIETDGHSGDAGTKTRVEAFLHCLREDLKAATRKSEPNDFHRLQSAGTRLADVRPTERLLIPRLGPGSEVVAACFRGFGLPAETLAEPGAEAVRWGRRHTSGKECVPMCMTLGGLLERLEPERATEQRFVLVMPVTRGPCRFGVYNLLNRITLARLGWQDRVRIWSPQESGYFDGAPAGLALLIFTGMMASDLLLEALHDVRPIESQRGASQSVYQRYWEQLLQRVETRAGQELSAATALWEVGSGRLFGLRALLAAATDELAALRGSDHRPTVLVVGEIYVRCNAAANDRVIERLEGRGLRARLAPFNEVLEYADHCNRRDAVPGGPGAWINRWVQRRVRDATYRVCAERLGWGARPTVRRSLAAAAPFIPEALNGEAVLTVGAALQEWRAGGIDAVLSVGPLECMPSKLAETQFLHIAEQEGLLTLTLPVNGDAVDPEILDNFAFEVRARHERNRGAGSTFRRGALAAP